MCEAADVSHCPISEIFGNFEDSVKLLNNVADIKNELLNQGPIVSTSFTFSTSLVGDCFSMS